jgi:predicted AAA+ superfamily ATPase
MIKRLLNLPKKNSFFLFGPRGVGKSSLLRTHFPEHSTLWIDLLDPEKEEEYSLHPRRFKDHILSRRKETQWVVVDEIQKVPKLLNTIHQLIESETLSFALTGSSARRLKQKGVNLLAGRAWNRTLHPLSQFEQFPKKNPSDREFQRLLEFGSLPKLLQFREDRDRIDYLRAYATNYVQQEIQAEQWIRKLDPFRRFLAVCAQMNGKVLNYSLIARDVGADATTVKAYYEILEDTLMGFELPAYERSVRKQQRKSPKFYLFDTGVKRALEKTLDVPLHASTSAFGEAFEHWVILELKRLHDIKCLDFKWSYLLTKDGLEIDLICERPGRPIQLIEIKSTTQIREDHANSLLRIDTAFPNAELLLLSRDETPRTFGRVRALPFREGIQKIIGD